MARQFVPKNQGPAVIKAMSSNVLSDQYRDSITIAYQYLDSVVASTAFTFAGRTFDTPIMVGPVGGYERQENGALGFAKAIQEAGSVFWSHFHNADDWYEALAAGVPGVHVIKPLKDNDQVIECIKKDTEAGALAYAMDIDHGINPYGELDVHMMEFAPKTAAEIRAFSDASPLPFYLKGVLSAHDARIAAEAGAAGIVLSGHNNRYPCAVPPLKLLPEIKKEFGGDLQIFIDGGFTNGYDAFKALALGADGVLCARVISGAYLKDGPEGLTDKILEMTAELKGAMGNTGSPDLQHLNRQSVILP